MQALLAAWGQPIYAVFGIVAGALLDLPTVWVLPAVVVLGLVRVAARWPRGLATVAQGGVAVALGGTFYLLYGGPGGGPVLTTVLLGVALARAIAGPLTALAARSAPFEVTS